MIGSIISAEEQNSEIRFSLIDGLLRLPGLPEVAYNKLWEHASLSNWTLESSPTVAFPTSQALFTAAALSEGPKGIALAACLFDPVELDRVVRNYPRPSLWQGAVANPLFDEPATRSVMEASKVGEGLFETRDDAAVRLDGFLAGTSQESAADIASVLVAAAMGHKIIELLQTRSTSPEKTELAEALLAGFAQPSTAHALRVRAGLISFAPPALVCEIAQKTATTQFGWIDSFLLAAVSDLINSGQIQQSDVVALLDLDASAYAAHLGGTPALLVADETVQPAKKAKPVHPGNRKAQLEMTESLALIGLGNPARRMSLASNSGLTPADQRELVGEADAETVLDWAEGSLAHKPTADEVYEAISNQTPDRMNLLAKEVKVRHGDVSPELLCALPGFADELMTPAATRRAYKLLFDSLNSNEVGWEVAIGLLAQGWSDTILSLADTGVNMSLNPA